MDLDFRTSIALVGLSVLLMVAGPIAVLVDRLAARVRRRREAATAGGATPYRAVEAKSVDPSLAENRRLRRSLAATRVVALAPLAAAAAGLVTGAAPDESPARDAPAPSASAWPFDVRHNRVAAIGQRFDYAGGADGYQVGFEFSGVPAIAGRVWDVDQALLDLRVRARVIVGQTPRTEGIWVDGVLSGTTAPIFRVASPATQDVSDRNTAFTDALFACCREREGDLMVRLYQVLQGSTVTPRAALADGRLDVVIADDVEVRSARLHLCQRDVTDNCIDLPAIPLPAGGAGPRR